MKDFRDIKVWAKSHELTLALYRETRSFPREELYGLTSQIRRSAASIPANIAEGCCRGGDGEFAHFLQIAMGSASELDYHLLLSHDLGYLSGESYAVFLPLVTEVKRMLTAFIGRVRSTDH